MSEAFLPEDGSTSGLEQGFGETARRASESSYDLRMVARQWTSLREAVDLAFEYLNRPESNDLRLHLLNALAKDLPETA